MLLFHGSREYALDAQIAQLRAAGEYGKDVDGSFDGDLLSALIGASVVKASPGPLWQVQRSRLLSFIEYLGDQQVRTEHVAVVDFPTLFVLREIIEQGTHHGIALLTSGPGIIFYLQIDQT